MGKFKKIIRHAAGALLAAVLCAGFLPQLPRQAYAAGGSCGTSAQWNLNGGTLTISGSGAVTSAAWSGSKSSIVTVVIENGITSLPASAFSGYTALTSLTMADSVSTLGKSVCSGCTALKTVRFSNALQAIPDTAFSGCKVLTDLKLPANLTSIGSSAFYGGLGLKELVIPDSVQTIGTAAFYGNNVKSLTLGSSLKTIGERAFAQSCFASVVIPDSVQTIGSGAIGMCYTYVRQNGTTFIGGYSGSPGVTVLYGKSGSVAESYANSAKLKFVATDTASHTHAWSGWQTTKEPDCVNQGEQIRKCSCGASETQKIAALGHSMGSWTVRKAATCTERGEKVRVCSRCGEEETQSVAATGHSYDSPFYTWTSDYSKCTAKRACSACGDEESETVSASYSVTRQAAVGVAGTGTYTAKFKNSVFKTQTKTVEIPALDSKWSTPEYKWSSDHKTCTASRKEANSGKTETEKATAVYTVAIAATCLKKGTGVYTAAFKNSAFAEQTYSVELPATGHTWSEWTTDLAAGCESDGREIRTCSGCGETELRLTDPTGHKWGSWTTDTPAGCETAGRNVRTCANCGSKEYQEIPALGHDWGDWTVVKKPTIDAAGEQESKCKRCGKTRTQSIDKLTSYVVSVSANAGGTVSPSGETRVEEGGSLKITCQANSGYKIATVLLDGKAVTYNSGLTVSDIRSDHTVAVVFEQNAPQTVRSCLTVSASPKRGVWLKDETAFVLSDFTVTAVISENGKAVDKDITADCYTNSVPSGTDTVLIYYRGSDKDISAYFDKHRVSCTVSTALRGDIDRNSKVEVEDAMLALKNYVNDVAGNETPVLSDTQKKIADVDGKEGATLNDAVYILRYYTNTVAGLDPKWNQIIK